MKIILQLLEFLYFNLLLTKAMYKYGPDQLRNVSINYLVNFNLEDIHCNKFFANLSNKPFLQLIIEYVLQIVTNTDFLH